MMKVVAMPKRELRVVMKRFLKDYARGISIPLFADLAGVSLDHLKAVFLYETEPVTEYMQIRVSKAYHAWKNGEIAIMQNKDKSKYLEYRREAKPVMQRTTGLQVINGQIKMKIGISNKYDYSAKPLDEQLGKG
jgi:hypothetical protein